jgi:hypothetical protein
MTQYYKDHRNASFEQARKYAARQDYPEYSQASHERFLKKAGGRTQSADGRKTRGGKQESPERCWRDLETGKFFTDFKSSKPGMQVAIYDLVDTGTIDLSYASAKKRSRRTRTQKR